MTLTAKQRNTIMSSKFETALKATMNNEIAVTANGACGYATSGKKLLDLNFATSSLRQKSAEEIQKMFADAFYENPLLAVKWLFMARDIRGGMGERRSFRICFTWLANARPELVKKLIPLVSEYGRFDDIFYSGLEDELWNNVVDVVVNQLEQDVKNMEAGKPVSLLAKWLPSCNTSSRNTVAIARKLIASLGMSEKQYRKTLAKLRAYLKVIEVKMSAKQWNEIDYEAVPSKANLKYNAAFLRNDEARRREFLGKLEKGEAKINSSANFPCDIVNAYKNGNGYGWSCNASLKPIDQALEAMWKAQLDYTVGLDTSSTIVVADGSGSMTSTVSGSMTALDVANSLAVYFAEKLNGPYKNKYITFSETPKYVDFTKANTLREKLAIALQHNEVANTNIEAVFDLVLDTAVRNGLKQEDLPANILIVSDMAFDMGTSWRNAGYGYNRYVYADKYSADKNALFESIKQKWQNAGYKLPRLVYWNVASGAKSAIPLQTNELGVALLSGYSPAIAKMAFSAKLDPYEVLVDALNVPRYQPVADAVAGLVVPER